MAGGSPVSRRAGNPRSGKPKNISSDKADVFIIGVLTAEMIIENGYHAIQAHAAAYEAEIQA